MIACIFKLFIMVKVISLLFLENV